MPASSSAAARLLHVLFLAPVDGRLYALVRMAFALVCLVNLATQWPHRHSLFSSEGMVDQAVVLETSRWPCLSVFIFDDSPALVTGVMLVVGAALVLLLAGVLPRAAAVVVFLWHLSFTARCPLGVTGWDLLLRAFSFLVLISPVGRAWSLPRLLGWQPALVENVPRHGITLMRLQVLVLYLQTVWLKLYSPYWINGEFMSYYLLSHNARWPGLWVVDWESLLALVTWTALLVEAAIPLLLLIRRTRFVGIALGLMLHGGICILSRNLELFFLTMAMSYLPFLRSEDVQAPARRQGKKR